MNMVTLLMDLSADVDDNDELVYDFGEYCYDLEHLTLVHTKHSFPNWC